MADLPAAHCAKISVQYLLAPENVQAMNTFYLQDTSDAIFLSPSATLAAIATAITTRLKPVTHSNISWNQLTFEDVRTVPYGGVTIPLSPLIVGTLATPSAAPNDLACSIKKSTGTLGRSARGRWYWSIGDVTELNLPNQIKSASAAAWVAALGNFQLDIETALSPALFGIVSFQHNRAPVNPGLFQHVTAWGVTDLVLDNQRRRLPGRGR